MEETKHINMRINVSTSLNSLLIIQKTIQKNKPNHEWLPMITERINELEQVYGYLEQVQRELSVSRQRNYDLEMLSAQLTMELKAEKNLSNELMKGL
jgi:hypothetical protein